MPEYTPEFNLDSPVAVNLQQLMDLRHIGESLKLIPKQTTASQSGGYRANIKGRGMEFDEVRPYANGDDIRMLDWKVTARTNKPHTKLFREEHERPIQLCVDLRPGMFFATRGVYKSVWSAKAAALLAWSSLKQGDRLGGLIFSNEGHSEVRPNTGSRGVLAFLKALAEQPVWRDESASPSSDEAFYQSLLRLRRVTRPGSLVFLFSDFSGLDKRSEAQLYHLGKHNDLVMVACFDPLDKQLPEHGDYTVDDGQRRLRFGTVNRWYKKAYAKQHSDLFAQLQKLSHLRGISLVSAETSDDPLETLKVALGARKR